MAHDELNILGRKIVWLFAHPDDECYTAAGTIYENYRNGGENYLICATAGEQGASHLPQPRTPGQLRTIRKRELRDACRLLHVNRLYTYDFPDGRVLELIQPLYEQSLKTVKKIEPEIIISFGTDGITGHLDHITVGQVARQIARRLRLPIYNVTLPPRTAQLAHRWLHRRRLSPRYLHTRIKYRTPTLFVSIDRLVKEMALRCHRSQMDGQNAFTGFPEYAVREVLNYEYFVRG